MAWYSRGGWDYYPPYVSVAEKKANGARALAKLLKKSKRTADPVVIAHRKRQFTTTFWAKPGLTTSNATPTWPTACRADAPTSATARCWTWRSPGAASRH